MDKENINARILALIQPRTKDNPIRKGVIRFEPAILETEISDRDLRKAIEELRGTPEGCFICSSSKGGYYMAQDLEELGKAISSDERRAVTILQRCRAQRKNAKLEMNPIVKAEIESQVEMFATVGDQLELISINIQPVNNDPLGHLSPDGKRKR